MSSVKIVVKRGDDAIEMAFNAAGLPERERMRAIGIVQRALSDAFDLFLSIHNTYQKDNSIKEIALNMVEFRKVCKHRGDEEESTFIKYLSIIFATKGYTIDSIGFPFDKHGRVSDDSTLYISITGYKELKSGSKFSLPTIPVAKQ